jgi:hypothetical protein
VSRLLGRSGAGVGRSCTGVGRGSLGASAEIRAFGGIIAITVRGGTLATAANTGRDGAAVIGGTRAVPVSAALFITSAGPAVTRAGPPPTTSGGIMALSPDVGGTTRASTVARGARGGSQEPPAGAPSASALFGEGGPIHWAEALGHGVLRAARWATLHDRASVDSGPCAVNARRGRARRRLVYPPRPCTPLPPS